MTKKGGWWCRRGRLYSDVRPNEHLEAAYVQHSNTLATLKVEPGFDPLRADPRYQALLRRVGLAE